MSVSTLKNLSGKHVFTDGIREMLPINLHLWYVQMRNQYVQDYFQKLEYFGKSFAFNNEGDTDMSQYYDDKLQLKSDTIELWFHYMDNDDSVLSRDVCCITFNRLQNDDPRYCHINLDKEDKIYSFSVDNQDWITNSYTQKSEYFGLFIIRQHGAIDFYDVELTEQNCPIYLSGKLGFNVWNLKRLAIVQCIQKLIRLR